MELHERYKAYKGRGKNCHCGGKHIDNLCILNYVQEYLQHYNHVAMTLCLTLVKELEWDGPMTPLC
jgi:hypothetical protein